MNRLLPSMVLCLAACGVETPETDPTGATTPTTPTQPTAPTPPPQPPQQQMQPLTGLPCDVQEVLQQNCASCHATGNDYATVWRSRDDLLRVVDDGTGRTMGAVAVDKMSTGAMPPYGATQRPTADQRETVAGWVDGGMPAGACGDLTAP
jgi:hypothetical protein